MRLIDRMCSAPVAVGHTPVMIAVRAGAQTGALAQALSYMQPRRARRSMFGVVEYSSPQQCRCGPMSSHVNQRKFGRSCCAEARNGEPAAAVVPFRNARRLRECDESDIRFAPQIFDHRRLEAACRCPPRSWLTIAGEFPSGSL